MTFLLHVGVTYEAGLGYGRDLVKVSVRQNHHQNWTAIMGDQIGVAFRDGVLLQETTSTLMMKRAEYVNCAILTKPRMAISMLQGALDRFASSCLNFKRMC